MKMIKKLLLLVSLIGILFILNTAVEAAGVSIKTSKSTVRPGESFKVTVSVSNGAGYVSASVSNGSGGFGSTWLENGSKSFTCKAGSSGNVTIKTSGTVADFSTEKDESASRSKSVKIQPKTTTTTTKKDNNKTTTAKKEDTTKAKEENKKEEKEVETPTEEAKQEENYSLKSLEIEGVELLPEFKSDVFEYTIKVEDKDKLDMNAIANSSNIIVNITGNENLQLGENTILITLKGQDDKEVVSYKIKVIKEKSELTVAKEKIQKLETEKRILIGTNIILVVITVGGISTAIIKMKKYKKYDEE